MRGGGADAGVETHKLIVHRPDLIGLHVRDVTGEQAMLLIEVLAEDSETHRRLEPLLLQCGHLLGGARRVGNGQPALYADREHQHPQATDDHQTQRDV